MCIFWLGSLLVRPGPGEASGEKHRASSLPCWLSK
ncbi:hypothetical protein A2U01_0059998, partial [Trifolium medium]|nr:hypothetical protein [Trifolium medium]